MFARLALFAALCLGLIVAKAPASLLDTGLAAVSANAVRLGGSEGTLWRGQGMLVVGDAASGNARPWLPLAWHFKPGGLLGGEMSWASAPESGLRGELSLGLNGFRLRDFAVEAPAAMVIPLLPGVLVQSGWGGDMAVRAADWRCSPNASCEGDFLVQWRGASSALLPGQRFGDYEVQGRGNGSAIHFDIHTLAGEIAITGSGSWSVSSLPSFQGRISSPPEVLKQLPNIAGGAVVADAQPGHFVVRFPVQH